MKAAVVWITIIIIVALCVGLFFGFRSIVDHIAALDRDVATVMLASCVTILISAMMISGSVRRLSRAQVRPEKADTYRELVEAWLTTIADADKGPDFLPRATLPNAAGSFERVERAALLWCPPRVIKHHLACRQFHFVESLDSEEFRQAFTLLLESMRRDLGEDALGFDSSLLLRLGGLDE